MSKPYNGHPSWAYWNVTLWLGNDEPLYRMALSALAEGRSVSHAAALLALRLDDMGIKQTPDGARYSLRALEHALRCLKD